MREDTALRFKLGDELMRMRYGSARAIPVDVAHKAWPPTGDADRSFEGAMRALALAAGGNRPETTYTTAERIINDLDGSFEVEQDPYGLDWIITRRLKACPHCHGSGIVRVFDEPPPAFDPDDDSLIATDIAASRIEPCGHRP